MLPGEGLIDILSILAYGFLFFVGAVFVIILLIFIVDITQNHDSVRRNYPVIGRFRGLFTHLGEFFRQYFFALDREELPFNRAERDWVNRASDNEGSTIAFGSTRNLLLPGTSIFLPALFPPLQSKSNKETDIRTIGLDSGNPYTPGSFFNISAMSYGALSRPAVLALSHGAAKAGCWMNTGEGGLSSHHLKGGCDIVFQIGTAKYGVRNEDGHLNDGALRKLAAIEQVKMFEIKLSQGAKPGKGGILPGEKVTEEIARIRGIEKGQSSLSPNRHKEIEDIESLLRFINHVRDVVKKPVGFKFVLGDQAWIEDFCAHISKIGIKKAPDFITLDSGDGGSGAAPMPLMDNVGLRLFESLPTVHLALKRHGLRDRIALIASGKLLTPGTVATALATGADFVNSARGFMFALGCIQSLRCHKNTCPTGITTHNPRYQRGLDPADKQVRVQSYCENIRHEVEVIAHSCGVDHPNQLRPHHLRLVQPDGRSRAYTDIWPEMRDA